MAVYDRRYRPYEGELTESRWRFLVIPRFAFREVFNSKFFLSLYVLCFGAPIVGSIIIYLHHNLEALQILGIASAQELIQIGPAFFEWFAWFQSVLLYLVVLIVGPALISADLTNNALPLYLSRPFSRTEYLLGKFSVIAILGAPITLVPLSLMFLMQAYLEGGGWLADNWRIGLGVVLWPAIWITISGLLALTLSAWVKIKPLAGGLLVLVYLASGALGGMINGFMGTSIGDLISLPMLVASIIQSFFRGGTPSDIPVAACWFSVGILCALCLLLLRAKVKAYEVVR